MSESTFDQIVSGLARERAGSSVIIGDVALRTAINHSRYEKEAAIDGDDYELTSEWRDEEKQLMAALGGRGLRQTTKE